MLGLAQIEFFEFHVFPRRHSLKYPALSVHVSNDPCPFGPGTQPILIACTLHTGCLLLLPLLLLHWVGREAMQVLPRGLYAGDPGR